MEDVPSPAVAEVPPFTLVLGGSVGAGIVGGGEGTTAGAVGAGAAMQDGATGGASEVGATVMGAAVGGCVGGGMAGWPGSGKCPTEMDTVGGWGGGGSP